MVSVAGPEQSDFAAWQSEHAQRVDDVLDRLLPPESLVPLSLHAAMRWAALGPGKRVRACLLYGAAQACHASGDPSLSQALDRSAAAVELIHAYSLIHDDLPCMDDDSMRRGKPATHIQFGEAMALLAGDAMQPLAFEWLADMPISPALVVQSMLVLSRAIGSQGMAGGQAVDLLSTGQQLDQAALAAMHGKKTGALLGASVQLGAIVVGADSVRREALRRYSEAIGLAFQVVDDVLDATVDTEQLGKTAGKDLAADKATYVSLLGVDQARSLAQTLKDAALEALVTFGPAADRLRGLAEFVVRRVY
jgi:farnesyl diphosphate synthase